MTAALLLIGQLTAAAPHWPAGARVPVWIDASRAPAGAAVLVERAMKTWTDASDGRLTLVRAATNGEAAIRIFFVQSDTNYGEAAPRVDPGTGFIARADVAINAAVPDNPMDARIIIYLTALHELGHALGLTHSDTFSAIMYRFRRADDGVRYFGAYRSKVRSPDEVGLPAATGLDPEDVKALRNLYAERPRAQDRSAIWSGVYTAGQAERGKAVYASHCSRCHGDDLGKNRSYPLAGEGFMEHWEASTLERLFNQIRQMPPGAPATLNDGDRRDAMAYLLQQNGFPEGRTDLTSDEAILATVQIVRRNGPGPLTTGAVVRVAGCLAKRSEREWELTGATEPERTALPTAPAAGRPRPNTIAEGNRTVALMNAFPNPADHQGHTMLAVGFLVRTPDGDAVNVVSLEMLAPSCAR